MSSPNPMTREELIESAALDAYGLLDEYESALYTRSFHHAPAAVQDEIIHMQADFVSDEHVLPDVNPDPALRERVLEAVAGAIEQETAELEPLATIGRPRRNEAEVAGVIHNGNGARFWRAAAFVLVSALVVAAYFDVEANRQNRQITIGFLYRLTNDQLEKEIGPPIKDFIFNPAAKWKNLKAIGSANASVHATLVYSEDSDTALLVLEGLPRTDSQEYTLTAVSPTREEVQLKAFAGPGQLAGVKIALNGLAATLSTMTLQITDRANNVILSTA